MGTGRHLVPMLVKHIHFEEAIIKSFDDTNSKLYRYTRGLIEEFQSQPLGLKEMCRFRIRCWLVNVLEKTVYQLPLPKLLIRYLLFEDIQSDCEDMLEQSDM